MSGFYSPWRARLGLLIGLLLLILVNVGILIVYRVFYEDRLLVLSQEQQELLNRREETRKVLERLRERETRLTVLQEQLEAFFSDTLGTRKERLAPLIEDIYKMTGELGLRPGSIGYSEPQIPGAQQIDFSFAVDGKYADVKKLLYAFETSPRFMVVENVSVTTNETQPDVLHVTFSVSHFFRSETTRIPKKVARPGGKPEKRPRASTVPLQPAEGSK